MVHKHRQTVCLVAGLLSGCLTAGQQATAQPVVDDDTRPFSRQWLADHARDLSRRAYSPESMDADNALRTLDYEDYRRIAFDSEAVLWADEARPFRLGLFPPGYLYTTPVDIHLVAGGTARRVQFTTDLFDYEDSPVAIDETDAGGYAGFRVHHPINTPERSEEFLVFLGASYFRAVGKDQVYGLSARGLAVDTVGPGSEEFPHFSDFWIERPDPDADELIIHALLDSPSVTGAYQFTVVPGERTRIRVDATLYPREDMAHVGIAPLTSMFLFDSTNRARFDDFRNAVHDSGGLQILQANGEQVWRPLSNPRTVQVSSFGSGMPTGFGLLQRHHDFNHFNDDEARYDKRPSLWIEPLGDWGAGHVELVEIPTDTETNDNIVAYWQPARALEAGNEYRFRYRMHWGRRSPRAPEQGRIVDTAAATENGERVFVIDYSAGRRIPDIRSDPDAVRIRATTSAGTITEANGTLVEATGRYRAYVKLDPGEASLAELRVTLHVGDRQWGETWLYRWTR